jgi:putative tricarboxylic transport membrane protein
MIYDRWTSLFWFALSLFACIKSLSLGIGALNHPGPGLFPFGASGILGILSGGLFVHGTVRKADTSGEPLFVDKNWKRVVFMILAVVIYAKILTWMGYLTATFLLMLFVFWLAETRKWYWILFSSAIVTGASYLVFSVWLKCQFPTGIFRF